MIISFKLPDDNVEIVKHKSGETTVFLKFETDKAVLVFKSKKDECESDNAVSVSYDRQQKKFRVGTI